MLPILPNDRRCQGGKDRNCRPKRHVWCIKSREVEDAMRGACDSNSSQALALGGIILNKWLIALQFVPCHTFFAGINFPS